MSHAEVDLDQLFIPVDPDDVARERNKARLLKASAWWKNRLGQGMCHYCGRRFPPRQLTLDHVTPLIRGGRTERANCVPACQECNRLKRNLPAQSWRKYLDEQRKNI